MREIRAKANAPIWHENDDGRFALKITKAGREAIGVSAIGALLVFLLFSLATKSY